MSKDKRVRDLAVPKELNAEQDTFAREMVKHGDRLLALRTAYPESNYADKSGYTRGSQLLQNPHIVKRIEDLQMIVLERALQESEYNLEVGTEELMDLIRMAKEQMAETGLKKTPSDLIVKCIQELNKMYKLTTPNTSNVNVTSKDGGQVLFVNASDIQD